jgi:hypothetical protein
MGRKTWLNSGAISAQPTQSLSGLMVMTAMKALGFINALNAMLWVLRIKLKQLILKSRSFDALNAVLGCLSIRSALHVRFS